MGDLERVLADGDSSDLGSIPFRERRYWLLLLPFKQSLTGPADPARPAGEALGGRSPVVPEAFERPGTSLRAASGEGRSAGWAGALDIHGPELARA